MTKTINSRTGSSKSSTEKPKTAKHTSIETFARNHEFYGEIKLRKDGSTYALFTRDIFMDKDRIGKLIVEHEYYPEHNGSDEWVKFEGVDKAFTMFESEATDLAAMLNVAAELARKLDKLHKIK